MEETLPLPLAVVKWTMYVAAGVALYVAAESHYHPLPIIETTFCPVKTSQLPARVRVDCAGNNLVKIATNE